MENSSNYVILDVVRDETMPSRDPQSLVLIPVQIPKIQVPILVVLQYLAYLTVLLSMQALVWGIDIFWTLIFIIWST